MRDYSRMYRELKTTGGTPKKLDMLKALAKAIEFVERNPEAFCEDGLWFKLPVGAWGVEVAFDGFASLHNEKTGQRANGRVPKHLMPRVAKLLPGFRPPTPDYGDEPF